MKIKTAGRARKIIDFECRELTLYKSLPEDVRAVLNLFSDDYSLDIWVYGEKERERGYIDVFNEAANVYLFSQTQHYIDINARRFVSWVRAGMPGGYTNTAWEKED